MILYMPQYVEKGLNYALLQADLKENQGLSVMVEMRNQSFTQEVSLPEGKETFTIIYPVTIRDRIAVYIEPKKGTIVENFRYAQGT